MAVLYIESTNSAYVITTFQITKAKNFIHLLVE